MNLLERDQQKLHSKMALFHPLSVFVLFFFTFHIHLIDLFLLLSSPDPCGIIPSLFYSHAIHSDVYRSLVWRRVCVCVCVYEQQKNALGRESASGFTRLSKNVPVRLLKICFIWFC